MPSERGYRNPSDPWAPEGKEEADGGGDRHRPGHWFARRAQRADAGGDAGCGPFALHIPAGTQMRSDTRGERLCHHPPPSLSSVARRYETLRESA